MKNLRSTVDENTKEDPQDFGQAGPSEGTNMPLGFTMWGYWRGTLTKC